MTAAVLALVVCGQGCTSIVGINEPHDRQVTPDATVAPFLGSWQTTTGTTTLTCNGTPQQLSDQGGLVITRGTSSDLLVTSASCTLAATIQGNVARLAAGQTCTERSATETDVFVYDNGTFTLDAAGATATVAAAGTVTVTLGTSAPVSCSFTQADPYTKAD